MSQQLPPTESINASEMRQHFAEVVNRVYRRERRFVIEKSGIPVAAVVSVADAQRLERMDERRRRALATLERVRESFHGVDQADFDRELELAMREVRAELDDERP
jgi:prevent-host-death family protein